MSQYKVEFDSVPWESPAPCVRFKRFEQAGRQVRLVEFSRGFVEPDWCVHGHIGYVLDGRCEIDFDGHVVEYGPGDGIFIPSGERHKHKASVPTATVTVILVEDIAG
jgi:quercetin dioxygenase-like cupin family protein